MDLPVSMKSNVKCIIKSEIKRKRYRRYDGVRLLAPDRKATAWAILSCPSALYQKALQFSTDTFAVIEEHGTLRHWTMTHYLRDVHRNKGFKHRVYDLLSGVVVAGEGAEKVPEKEEIPIAEEEVELVDPHEYARLRAAERRRRHKKHAEHLKAEAEKQQKES